MRFDSLRPQDYAWPVRSPTSTAYGRDILWPSRRFPCGFRDEGPGGNTLASRGWKGEIRRANQCAGVFIARIRTRIWAFLICARAATRQIRPTDPRPADLRH